MASTVHLQRKHAQQYRVLLQQTAKGQFSLSFPKQLQPSKPQQPGEYDPLKSKQTVIGEKKIKYYHPPSKIIFAYSKQCTPARHNKSQSWICAVLHRNQTVC